MKATKLTARDLALLKQHWLKTELRDDKSWERFLKTFDVTRQYTVDPRGKGVEVPVRIKSGGRENIMLLVRTGALKRARPGALASLTIQQLDARGQLAGGSTFVFKQATPQ